MNKPISQIKKSYLESNPPSSISILSVNVGNFNLRCRKYLNKLCDKEGEEIISSNIKTLAPDIIALQEVLAPWQCNDIQEGNSKLVCFDKQNIPQIRRLLGDQYTIACNSRNQFECIGVRVGVGEIINCPDGSICNNARTVKEITGCDNGFTISAITLKLSNGVIFDVANFHPPSINPTCRAKMIDLALFGDVESAPILQQDLILLMGDFNLDPWRDSDASSIIWNNFMDSKWRGASLRYHSGIVEHDPPFITTSTIIHKKTVDFVVSNFAHGSCIVLGETPSTPRLDGGHSMDHRAIYGRLVLPIVE